MNIAFSTILIVLIILPGLLFLKGYHSNDFSSKYFKTEITKLIPSVLIPALFLHLFFLLILELPIFGYYPNIQYIGILLTSDNTKELNEVFKNISTNFYKISFYFIVLYFFSLSIGYLSWLVIRKTKFDRRLPIFRFPNRWYYILTGEIFDFPKKDKKNNKFESSKNITIRYVDVLVQVGSYSLIYSGILHNFMLSVEGNGVDCIKLRNVKRKKISLDGQSSDFKKIPGEYLLLPFSEVKNINITYYNLTDYVLKIKEETKNPELKTAISKYIKNN